MNSPSPGNKQATFVIDYTGGSTMVTVTGEPYMQGDMGSGTDTPLKSSYYACSTASSGCWPIVFAIAFLAIRRRRRPT
jgi:hypothetical protein